MRQWTNHHWFRWKLVAWTVPSHYLNQCWYIVNSKLILSEITTFSFNAFENSLCKMSAVLSRPQYANQNTVSSFGWSMANLLKLCPKWSTVSIRVSGKPYFLPRTHTWFPLSQFIYDLMPIRCSKSLVKYYLIHTIKLTCLNFRTKHWESLSVAINFDLRLTYVLA